MKPLIKWIGGKQKLASDIAERLPSGITEYHEPFAGGAALFCELWNGGDLDACDRITLGDKNPHLMALYAMVQDPRGSERFKAAMDVYRTKYDRADEDGRSEMYYESRTHWNAGDRGQDPARFVFLKQHAFNGLWRVNRAGELNAAWGKYKKANLPSDELIDEWHRALQCVDLRPEPYELLEPGEGGLVYIDPPYLGTFTGYTEDGFDHAAQTRLLCRMWQWREAGALTAYSNTFDVEPLLRVTWPEAEVHELETTYVVNTKGSGRTKVPELLAV